MYWRNLCKSSNRKSDLNLEKDEQIFGVRWPKAGQNYNFNSRYSPPIESRLSNCHSHRYPSSPSKYEKTDYYFCELVNISLPWNKRCPKQVHGQVPPSHSSQSNLVLCLRRTLSRDHVQPTAPFSATKDPTSVVEILKHTGSNTWHHPCDLSCSGTLHWGDYRWSWHLPRALRRSLLILRNSPREIPGPFLRYKSRELLWMVKTTCCVYEDTTEGYKRW